MNFPIWAWSYKERLGGVAFDNDDCVKPVFIVNMYL